jgi:hypothetical protein
MNLPESRHLLQESFTVLQYHPDHVPTLSPGKLPDGER